MIRFCISSTDGNCLLNSSGKVLPNLYSLIPIGLLISFKEYSATRLFLLLQSNNPIVGLSVSFFQFSVYWREIKIQLSRIFGLEVACFEFNYDITAEIKVVKQQIDIKIVAADGQVILITEKSKARAEFKQQ